jgi:hypothetical protein
LAVFAANVPKAGSLFAKRAIELNRYAVAMPLFLRRAAWMAVLEVGSLAKGIKIQPGSRSSTPLSPNRQTVGLPDLGKPVESAFIRVPFELAQAQPG